MTREQFIAMPRTEQERWLRRETWKVRIMSSVGWLLIGGCVLFCTLVVFKTWYLFGLSAAVYAAVIMTLVMLMGFQGPVWLTRLYHHYRRVREEQEPDA